MTKRNEIDPDTPLHCNCARLRRAARVVTRLYDECLAPTGINTNQFTILGYLFRQHGPLRMMALGELLAMDRATIGHNLKPLERDGYITIAVDKADRRARLVSVTKAGIAKIVEAYPHWVLAQDRFESEYGRTRSAQLRHMLDRATEQHFES
ncbi:MarR family winged helix-turn-helix transcriptional regulator [Paraburkholderia sp. MM5482-R1]|uniref:MarR family winged helix-turn-helix transcriptional regulator n=1 Tax=unclassified Paraburkholderia TaxID=2615204 RepID=UPI003D207737